MDNLKEIRRGETGTGLLIENDGYISPEIGDNKHLFESYKVMLNEGDLESLPDPFVVDAVFQKYGIENANGRIYPEDILKKAVDKYQDLIKNRMAIGECYRPETMILTENGWKHLYEVHEGENILTLNSETNEIEIKPIQNIIKYHYDGPMVNIKSRFIDDVVTPTHGFPIYDRNNHFRKFITAQEIHNSNAYSHFYIPKTGKWIGEKDEFIVLPKLNVDERPKLSKKLKEKYSQDLIIPIETFAKFMGIYLAEGSHSTEAAKSYKINIHQKKEDICIEIEKMLDEWGIKYTINENKAKTKTFVISDIRLWKYVHQFGLCYDKYVPYEIKKQPKDILRIFYDWFIMGDGRVRGDKRKGKYMSDDAFSTSRRLALDLNEIQLKIGYSGRFHVEDRQQDRFIEGRQIKAENTHPLYFSYRELSKGIYMDKRFIQTSIIDYNGDVMCVEVPNHIWYVMDNGYCHWTKNCNHPDESVIDLSRVAINIIELHWEKNTLVGKMEIPVTNGFRKYGIISCQADQVAHLILSGIKIGVSSRGLGSVTSKMGTLYVSDDYEIVCWDVVSTPSTPGAYIAREKKDLTQYIEGRENQSKGTLIDSLDSFNDWLSNF